MRASVPDTAAVGGSAAPAPGFAGNRHRGIVYILGMNTSVIGCATCGALYTPTRGDEGVCGACRITVPDDPSSRPLPPQAFDDAEPMARPSTPRRAGGASRPASGKGRALRRVVLGAVTAAAVVAGGAAAFRFGRRPLADAWSSIRRHSAADAWSALRRRASGAWVALREHVPIDALHPESSASADAATASRAGIQEASVVRKTHRRSHGKSRRSSE